MLYLTISEIADLAVLAGFSNIQPPLSTGKIIALDEVNYGDDKKGTYIAWDMDEPETNVGILGNGIEKRTRGSRDDIKSRHVELVCKLVKPGDKILSQLTGSDCNLLHMGIGVVGEAAELLDAIKSTTIYRKQIDLKHVIEELGDIEFFLEGLRQELQIDREDTLNHNIRKLSIRYSSGAFTDKEAQDRSDKNG